MQQSSPHLNTVNSWVDSMRPHWTRCTGNVHNDQKFWRECIHDQSRDLWMAVIEFYHDVRDEEIERRFPYLMEDLWTIAQRLDRNEPVTIPYNKQGHNKPVFRATMAIKDIIGKITGSSLDDITRQRRPKPTRKEIMAEFDALKARVDELFE